MLALALPSCDGYCRDPLCFVASRVAGDSCRAFAMEFGGIASQEQRCAISRSGQVAEANLVKGSSILVVPDWTEYMVRYYLKGSPAEATVNNKSAGPPTTVTLFLRQVSHATQDSFKREYPITLASLRRIVVLDSVTTSPSSGEPPAKGQQD